MQNFPDTPEVAVGTWRWSFPLGVVLFWGACFAGAELGHFLSFPGDIASLWPPSGIYLAALLLTGPRRWPVLVLTVVLANLATNLLHGKPMPVSLGFSVADSLEAVIGACLLRTFAPRPFRFSQLGDVIAFLVCSVLVATPIGAIVGAGVATRAFGGNYWLNWQTWWTSDALGVLLFAPLLLTCGTEGLQLVRSARVARILEAGIAFVLLAFVVQFVFGNLEDSSLWVWCPFLMWIAIRFEVPGIACANCLVVILAVWHMTRGQGPFTTEPLFSQRSVLLLAFLLFVTTSFLGLAVVVRERRLTGALITESEERHRRLLAVIPDAVFVNIDDRLAFCNEAMVRLLGASSAQELLGKPVLSFFHRRNHADINRRIEQMRFQGGSVPLLDEELLRLDGVGVPVEVTATAVSMGGKQGQLVVLRDLTSRKQDEERLRSSEKRFREMANAAPVMIWTSGADKACNWFNDPWLRFRGRTMEQELGMGWLEGVHPDDRQECLITYVQAFDARQPFRMEYRLQRRDGQYRWILDEAVPQVMGTVFQGYIGCCSDVSDARVLQEQLLASRHMLETVLNNIPQGVFWKDRHSRYLGCNSVVWRAFGVEGPEQIIGKTDHELPGLTREQADFFKQKDQELMASGQPILGIIEPATLPGGETIWMETNKIPLRDAGGQIIGVLGTWQDITERRKLEEQLRQSQKMEAFGQLAGGVAHDFNNLLTVISGYSDLLLSSLASGDPFYSSVQAIAQAGERAADLTRQLLAFSRKTVLAPKILNLNAVVAETEKMLRRLIGEDICLTTVLAPNVKPVKVDPGHLTQVLMNLAVNARDAMPQGGRLTIETRNVTLDEYYAATHSEAKPGEYVLLAISDTGCGMAPAVRARIFEPFFTTKGVGKGSGLGLAVVDGIIKQSGGNIGVYSEPDQGTTFKLYFPIVPDAETARQVEPPRQVEHGTETILLVEDEESVRGLALYALESHGYRVLAASDGPEALRLAEQHGAAIALLVTDVVMPSLGGAELAELLRTRFPTLKVLFVSGYTDDAVVRHGILHEKVEFLQKPYSPFALAARVRELLDQKDDGQRLAMREFKA